MSARNKFEHRSERSKAQDLSIEARGTGLIDDKEHVERWRRTPNEYDIAGVDDPVYGPQLTDLQLIKQLLRSKLKKFVRTSSKIIRKAKAEARAVSKSKKVPEHEKPKRIIKIREKAKRQVVDQAIKDREILEKTELRVHRATAASKRWGTERRRRAQYVADTTSCSMIQADSLIRRAHLKGWDYDVVDWDQMQGKDLSFDDRLERLEGMIGATYTESDFEQMVGAEQKAWDEEVKVRKDQADEIGAKRDYYTPADYEIPPEYA